MNSYEITFTAKARKELQSFDKRTVLKILDKLEEKLTEDPYRGGDGKLTDWQIPGLKYETYYKIRFGDFRVIYAIEDAVAKVVCVKIGERKEVYK